MPPFETSSSLILLIALGAYLLGSVPFGVIVARIMGLGDLREIGSGNIGATNVLRTGNKVAAVLTLLLDAGKGVVAVLVARAVAGEDGAQMAALAAFMGHAFPIWLKFKGGKGVATFIGAVLAWSFPVGVAVCVTWLCVAGATKLSSYAALVAVATSGLWAFLLGEFSGIVMLTVFIGLIFFTHRENVKRIKAGNEPKIGSS